MSQGYCCLYMLVSSVPLSAFNHTQNSTVDFFGDLAGISLRLKRLTQLFQLLIHLHPCPPQQ